LRQRTDDRREVGIEGRFAQAAGEPQRVHVPQKIEALDPGEVGVLKVGFVVGVAAEAAFDIASAGEGQVHFRRQAGQDWLADPVFDVIDQGVEDPRHGGTIALRQEGGPHGLGRSRHGTNIDRMVQKLGQGGVQRCRRKGALAPARMSQCRSGRRVLARSAPCVQAFDAAFAQPRFFATLRDARCQTTNDGKKRGGGQRLSGAGQRAQVLAIP
jgi:hypothetical protein